MIEQGKWEEDVPRTSLTERQQREFEFYQEFADRTAPAEVCFDPILAKERRPWNSYWFAIDTVRQAFRSGDQKLLDFGCGPGHYSILYSKIGYEVFGFDLSQNNIANAKRLATKYEVESRTHFQVGVAEELDYPSGFFDIVIGTDILHHVAIERAISECSRVLKKGGMAIFHEPIRVPLFDVLRETSLVRRFVSKEASLDRHVTHDERKLTAEDLSIMRSLDPNLSAQRFVLSSRLERFVGNKRKPGPSLLEQLDSRLFRWIPPLRAFGGIVVLTLRK